MATSPDPETHSHPSLRVATALLHAGRSLHLMGRYPFRRNPKGFAKLFVCLSLFASNLSAANGNVVGALSDRVGCSAVSHPLSTSGQIPAIMRWCPLYHFPATPSRAMGFIGVEFQSLSFLSTRAGTSTKHQQPELQAPSRQRFVYFLLLFYIHSAPITAVVSSPSCYNEHANFKQSIVGFLTASTKAIQKDKREPSHLGHGKNSIFQRKISTNYQGSQFSVSGFTY